MGAKSALIFGISGQDGSYLAEFLLQRNYRVYGTSRNAELTSFENLVTLGIRDEVSIRSLSLTDFRSVVSVVDQIRPDEIYFLSGQTSVALSFVQPIESTESIVSSTLNILEAVRLLKYPVRLFNAGSGECFGDTAGKPASEMTPFRPQSPYAVAKAASIWEVTCYRKAYGLWVCSGIMFNHESPFRPRHFVTRKIAMSAAKIAHGSKEKLQLGNLDIYRDWGWAQEYVSAMWHMLQQESPEDYVIATGSAFSLEEFIAEVFDYFGLNWRDHIKIDSSFFRPSDIHYSCGDASKAAERLGWKPQYHMKEVAKLLAEGEVQRYEDLTNG